MKKNEIVRLKIDGITNEGNGVGRSEGMAVFVPFTAVGDEIMCRIVKVNKSFAYGIVESVLSPSVDRIEPDCNVYKRCGGCSFRHLSYPAELSAKQSFVRDAFERIGGLEIPLDEISGCDEIYHYRNKAQYPVCERDGKLACGFYSKRSHRVVDNNCCLLQPEVFNEIAERTVELLGVSGFTAYNEQSGRGDVRHIYIRSGYYTKEIMLCVVAAKNDKRFKSALRELPESFPQIKSIVLNINPDRTNVVLGKRNELLFGKTYITDTICGNKVLISPHSFYQINTPQAEKLYAQVSEYADLSGNETLLDLYCGIGTIGMSLYDSVNKLIGVEIVPDAVKNAKENARLNGFDAQFICADAAEGAARLIKSGQTPDVIVADPARKGCDKQTLDAMISMLPEKIVMVSCNPSTAARDIKYLCENGYKAVKGRAVDMFPRTAHVECVVKLKRE
ncbi:MAG: 23S rRNA (uracil(1939)-C(5))-methyltransferase RlmD [Ruminococcus sp.]|nr:23S rRNA (uracil(1939)-C(5))-methyltransferase RlmD [Ruminococcus sp.]